MNIQLVDKIFVALVAHPSYKPEHDADKIAIRAIRLADALESAKARERSKTYVSNALPQENQK